MNFIPELLEFKVSIQSTSLAGDVPKILCLSVVRGCFSADASR